MSFWKFTDQEHLQTVLERLAGPYRFDQQTPEAGTYTVLDDFDWDIWRSECLLLQDANRELTLYRQTKPIVTGVANKNVRFWWQLKQGELAQQLKSLIDVRAFVPQYTFEMQTQKMAILNSDDKTIARLQSYSLTGENQTPLYCVDVTALRGYESDLAELTRTIETMGGAVMDVQDLSGLVRLTGLEIDYVPSKPTFGIEAQETTEDATLRMMLRLVELSQRYEPGILEDIDTEFVHQARVSIRKARSLVSLFKKSFTTERQQVLKTQLKAMGSTTNTLRDLDVFLLDADHYRSLLPEDFRPGLEPFFKRLQRQRSRVLKQTVAHLAGDRYQQCVTEVLQQLKRPADLILPQASLPIKALVQKKVLKQYKRICREGLAIHDSAPDRLVHDVRIECKKMRYLLELFAELFPPDQIKALVRKLKKLQVNLGRFNDYSVQGAFLRDHRGGQHIPAEQQASINGLIAVLYQKQKDEQAHVQGNLLAFRAKSVQDQFEDLCKTGSEERR